MDRFLHFLIQNADTHPKEIDYAVYWLRQKFLKRFASKNSMILFEQLVNLNSCDMHGRELCAQADYELF
jgi:hypothetical protein